MPPSLLPHSRNRVRGRLARAAPSAAALTLGCATAAAAGGCAAIPLAMIGTALGVAGSAASVGGSVYSQGKLDSAEMATPERWSAAVRAAAADLNLSVFEVPPADPDGVRTFTLADDHKAKIGVRVEPRTRTLLLNRIDVGLFGSEPTARLLLERVRRHAGTLDDATKEPAGER